MRLLLLVFESSALCVRLLFPNPRQLAELSSLQRMQVCVMLCLLVGTSRCFLLCLPIALLSLGPSRFVVPAQNKVRLVVVENIIQDHTTMLSLFLFTIFRPVSCMQSVV